MGFLSESIKLQVILDGSCKSLPSGRDDPREEGGEQRARACVRDIRAECRLSLRGVFWGGFKLG